MSDEGIGQNLYFSRRAIPRMGAGTMNKKVGAVFVVLLIPVLGEWSVIFAVGCIRDTDGTIHVSYKNHIDYKEKQGRLRVVSEPTKCRKNETPLSWSQPASTAVERCW